MTNDQPPARVRKQVVPIIALSATSAVIIASASFYFGTIYQKHLQSRTVANTTASTAFNGTGFSGQRRNRVVGQVTAISATSISIQNSRTNATVTLAITSATQITNNGQTAAATDIQVGETVVATKDSTNATQAASILVNPSLGGGPMQQSYGPAPNVTAL